MIRGPRSWVPGAIFLLGSPTAGITVMAEHNLLSVCCVAKPVLRLAAYVSDIGIRASTFYAFAARQLPIA